MIDKLVIGAFCLTFIVGLFTSAMVAGDIGERKRAKVTIANEIEKLNTAWAERDFEFFECSKIPFGKKYRYSELAALRASMCTAVSPIVSAPGTNWKTPAPPLPEGFSLVEE